MKLSIALITFNEEANLPRTLESVKPLVRDGQGEIIVVDSGSTDRTLEIARSFGAKIFSESWKGFAVQKNSAMEKASGDYAAIGVDVGGPSFDYEATLDKRTCALLGRRLASGGRVAINIAGGGLTILATPLAMLGAPVVVLIALSLLGSFIGAPYNIAQVSLRQAITPDRVQGRMNATMRTIVWGTVPIGSFLGGVLGSQIGIIQTILLGGAISTFAALWIVLGPVIRVKEQPAPVSA